MKSGGAKFTILIVVAPLILGACGLTEQGTAFRDLIFGSVEKAAANGLINAEKFLCRLAPVGAVKDRYTITPEKAAAYAVICNPNGPATIIKKEGS